MTSKKIKGKATRNRYSDEYKAEALALAERVGVPGAARALLCQDSCRLI